MHYCRDMTTRAGFLLLAALAAGVRAEPAPGPAADGRYVKWERDAVMVEVHRSMRLVAPENSLAAARECYLAGGDAIDCDVRCTLDGVVICFHDADPSRRGSAMFYGLPQLTWAEVRTVLIEPLSYPGSGQTIPRFEDILRCAIANNMAIYIDAKESAGRSGADALTRRYGASHLARMPNWPLVYYWTSRADHDLVQLGRLMGPGTFQDLRGKAAVTLAEGQQRSFRVDDPRILVSLLGRKPAARGPWRDAVPERPPSVGANQRSAESLQKALPEGGRAARLAAAELCARFPDQAAAFAASTLNDQTSLPPARAECLWMLGQLGSPASAPALKAHLASKDARQRELAAYGLGRLAHEGALEDLLGRLGDDDSMAAAAAAWAVWRIGRPQSAEAVVRALDHRLSAPRDGDEQAVRMLLLAAGGLRAAAAVETIGRRIADKAQATNVNMAIASLGAIGGREAVAAARNLFAAHGRAADGHTFCRAMAAAGQAGTPQLASALAGEDSRVVMDATLTLPRVPDAVKVLAPLVAGGRLSAAARLRVIAVLVLRPDAEAESLLKTLSRDADASVADQARRALTARGGSPPNRDQ